MSEFSGVGSSIRSGAGEGQSDEGLLQRRTYEMLDDRLRMHSDINFLQHYLSVAQNHARDHELAAVAANQSAMEQHKRSCSLMETLHLHRTDLAVESTALRQAEATCRKKEQAFAKLEQQLRGELAALRSQLAVEEKGANAAAQHAAMLESQLEEARRNTSVEAVAARVVVRDRELAEAEHLRVTSEAAERDELAAVAVQQSLAKIEADFAQERAVHQARGRSHQNRLKDLEELFGGSTRNLVRQGTCASANNDLIGHSLRRGKSGSPFALDRLASDSAFMDLAGDATPAQGSKANASDRVSDLSLVDPIGEAKIESSAVVPARGSRPIPACLPDAVVSQTANATNAFGMPAIGYDQSPTGQHFNLVAPAATTPSSPALPLPAPTPIAPTSLAGLPTLPVVAAGAMRRVPSLGHRSAASRSHSQLLALSPMALQLALPMA